MVKSIDFMVKVRSVSFPSDDIFWTTISTFIEFCERGLNIEAAIPGLSLTPTNVTFASLSVDEMPVIILLLITFFRLVINVPDLFTKDDFTSILILFNLNPVLNVLA